MLADTPSRIAHLTYVCSDMSGERSFGRSLGWKLACSTMANEHTLGNDGGVQYKMNANAFRHFYDYHFAENRKIWDTYITSLSYEQFTQHVDYSHGSVRDQIVHLLDAEDVWFSELRSVEPSDPLPSADLDDRGIIRSHWDSVEHNMRSYLAELRDEMLFDKPIEEPEEDKDLFVWQVLLHVVNHGTDHRAQLLRNLHDLGVKTEYQDYIFYAYAHPL